MRGGGFIGMCCILVRMVQFFECGTHYVDIAVWCLKMSKFFKVHWGGINCVGQLQLVLVDVVACWLWSQRFCLCPPKEKQTSGMSISLDIQTPKLRRFSDPQNIPKTPNLRRYDCMNRVYLQTIQSGPRWAPTSYTWSYKNPLNDRK